MPGILFDKIFLLISRQIGADCRPRGDVSLLRKIVCIVLAAMVMLAPVCPARAVSTSAVSAILVDAESGRVLYEHNADQRRSIASITKIMTAVVALEKGRLSDVYQVTASDMAEGSSMYLRKGEELTLEALLYGLMLPSGNDAALAVAHCVSRRLEDFVAAMNEKARELGMTGSSFANPNGLEQEGHYSTARDMAVLARYAMENELFRQIVGTKTITIEGHTLVNHNKLLGQYEGCIGIKTGYTKAAGRTLVTAAARNGQTLIAVTLCDGNDWQDHKALLEYGFTAYPATVLLAAGEEAAQVPLLGGQRATASLTAAKSLRWPLGPEERATVRLELPASLTAPAPAGAVAGYAVLELDGKELDRTALILQEDAPMSLALLPALG